MPEIGLSEVKTVNEVRDKIHSSEMRSQLEEVIKLKADKEYKKSEVNYKELIEERLAYLQRYKNAQENTEIGVNSISDRKRMGSIDRDSSDENRENAKRDLKKPYLSK